MSFGKKEPLFLSLCIWCINAVGITYDSQRDRRSPQSVSTIPPAIAQNNALPTHLSLGSQNIGNSGSAPQNFDSATFNVSNNYAIALTQDNKNNKKSLLSLNRKSPKSVLTIPFTIAQNDALPSHLSLGSQNISNSGSAQQDFDSATFNISNSSAAALTKDNKKNKKPLLGLGAAPLIDAEIDDETTRLAVMGQVIFRIQNGKTSHKNKGHAGQLYV